MLPALLMIIIPLLAAALVPVLRRRQRILSALPLSAAALGTLAFMGSFASSPMTVAWDWVGPFTLAFGLDGFRLALLGFVFVFQIMAGLYAMAALVRAARPALLCASILLAFASACGVLLTDNVLILLIFWEIFLLALYGAILSGGSSAEPVAQKALIIGGAGDFLMIFGLMLYLRLGGSPTFAEPLTIAGSRTALLAFVLVFLGAGAKAGMFPFHTWIPDAAEAMPPLGFAALPASLEKLLGISFLFKLTSRMFVLDHRAQSIMLAFAVATTFVVLLPALVEKNLKQVLAFTAISPVGFMIAGMATGEAAGIAGAIFYMLAHALYKSSLFMAAGTFEAARGSSRLADLRGVGRVVPAAGVGFTLAVITAVSLPPTGGFMAKELILESFALRGQALMLVLLGIGAALNMAVFCKLAAIILGRSAAQIPRLSFWEPIPTTTLGILAFSSVMMFTSIAGDLSARLGDEHLSFAAVWHLSPLTLASLAIYALGFALFYLASNRGATPVTAFEYLRRAPGLGRGLALAEQKTFDAYEIGVKSTAWMTRGVFRIERWIDEVMNGIIVGGQALSRRFLSAAHDGLYSHYLAWVVMGLILVLSLMFL